MPPIQVQDFGALAGVVAVTMATVQVFKVNFKPSPAVIVGIAAVTAEAWSVAAALIITHSDIGVAVMLGFIAWLTSMGAWSGAKAIADSSKGDV